MLDFATALTQIVVNLFDGVFKLGFNAIFGANGLAEGAFADLENAISSAIK